MKKSDFKKSTKSGKKYMITINGKTIHFGASGYQQYHDKIGLYSSLDHGDLNRRKRYRDRHKKIYNKFGVPSYRVKYTPAWFSWHYLW
jgi:hypothetical protein